MKKLLLVEKFFIKEELIKIKNLIENTNFKISDLGEESDINYTIINPDKVFSEYLDGHYRIIQERSGIFRKPIHTIHFETFETSDDWCFFVALKPTTFNLFYHNTGAESVLDEHKLNYADFTEWNYTTNILLEENQGLFFRPWLFHSIQGGLTQHYHITK